MATQTQAEQDHDLSEIQTYLSVTSLRVDRCRHESVTASSIWIFDNGGRNGTERQIAVIARLTDDERWERPRYPEENWRVSAILHGQPVTNRYCNTMLDAVGEMMRATKGI